MMNEPKLKNTLADLNNHLFAEMERLGDESLKGDELQEEIKRADAIHKVSDVIVKNADILKNAKKFAKHNLHVKWSIVKLSDARMDDFWKQSNP